MLTPRERQAYYTFMPGVWVAVERVYSNISEKRDMKNLCMTLIYGVIVRLLCPIIVF